MFMRCLVSFTRDIETMNNTKQTSQLEDEGDVPLLQQIMQNMREPQRDKYTNNTFFDKHF